jgi:predicted amidohydrolase
MTKSIPIDWRQTVFCFGWALLCVVLTGSFTLATEVKSFNLAALKLLPKPWDKAGNFAKLELYARRAAAAGADFIVTPEGYLEGYAVNRKLSPPPTRERYLEVAEPMDGPWIQKTRSLARELKVYLLLGFAERRQDKVYNTAAVFSPQGELLARYSKSHTGGELFNEQGSEFPVFSTPLGRMGILICFDRQLPETARILAIKGAQFILVPAFGLASTEMNEDILMRTRAYENAVYAAHVHPVNTFIVDPDGTIIAQSRGDGEEIVMARIALDERIGSRKSFRSRRPEIYGELLQKAAEMHP